MVVCSTLLPLLPSSIPSRHNRGDTRSPQHEEGLNLIRKSGFVEHIFPEVNNASNLSRRPMQVCCVYDMKDPFMSLKSSGVCIKFKTVNIVALTTATTTTTMDVVCYCSKLHKHHISQLEAPETWHHLLLVCRSRRKWQWQRTQSQKDSHANRSLFLTWGNKKLLFPYDLAEMRRQLHQYLAISRAMGENRECADSGKVIGFSEFLQLSYAKPRSQQQESKKVLHI